MANIAQEFMKSLGPEVSTQLAGSLGIKKQTATQIIPEVLPLILGGLKRQMETRAARTGRTIILNKYGSASVLDGIGDLFAEKAAEKKPDPKLGGLPGRRRDKCGRDPGWKVQAGQEHGHERSS